MEFNFLSNNHSDVNISQEIDMKGQSDNEENMANDDIILLDSFFPPNAEDSQQRGDNDSMIVLGDVFKKLQSDYDSEKTNKSDFEFRNVDIQDIKFNMDLNDTDLQIDTTSNGTPTPDNAMSSNDTVDFGFMPQQNVSKQLDNDNDKVNKQDNKDEKIGFDITPTLYECTYVSPSPEEIEKMIPVEVPTQNITSFILKPSAEDMTGVDINALDVFKKHKLVENTIYQQHDSSGLIITQDITNCSVDRSKRVKNQPERKTNLHKISKSGDMMHDKKILLDAMNKRRRNCSRQNSRY